MYKKYYDSYFKAICDTDKQKAHRIIHLALLEGISPEDLVLQVVSPSMVQFAKDFVDKKATLAQHYLSSLISGEIIEVLLKQFNNPEQVKNVVILGTPEGDFHGLGKKIVGGFLKSALFKVIDLGINVSPEKFVETAKDFDHAVIGVSSMMIHTALGTGGARGIRKILQEECLEKRYKLMVGGAPFCFDNQLWKKTGADAWAIDGIDAVKTVTELSMEMSFL